eukprot:scaffold3969_cov96-Skeletonema_menzelii.AAC.2
MDNSERVDAVAQPPALTGQPSSGLRFKGTLEEAQWRKLDTLCEKAQILPSQRWALYSRSKEVRLQSYGYHFGVEQKALAEERVKKEG